MKWTYTLIALCTVLLLTAPQSPAQNDKRSLKLKVMAWNILHGGNDLAEGPQRVIDIIAAIDPDIVMMVETYGSGKMIAQALGYHFHLIAQPGTELDDQSINLSIYSKYPFGKRIDTEYPFYLGGIEVLVEGRKINVFSNWFHYEPWVDAPEHLGKTVEDLLIWEKTGKKYQMLQKVLPSLKKYAAAADSIPLIIGGDFNTPSHLDWGHETKSMHNDLIVPWYTTKVLEDIGLIDSYREINPNPIWHPGITWDSKDAMDSHRIDYIFYKGGIKPISSETYMAFFGEPIRLNQEKITYPSDHGFIVTEFVLE